MESIWSRTVDIPHRDSLNGNKTVQAAVIGAGMAGVLIAYYLQQKGIEVIILEADRIGSGQTKNTTAKITLQHGILYHKLISQLGEDQAKIYAEANRKAISAYRSIIEENNIMCEFRECSSYLYTLEEGEDLKKEEAAAKKLGINAEFTSETELPFTVNSALRYYDQAVFHPLLFIKEVSKDLTIYEKTKVLSVEDHVVITETAKISAEHIIFASHFPFINKPGYYFMRMNQERSYVVALEETPQMDNIYYGIGEGGLSFRKSGNYLLVGGKNHRSGENRQGGRYKELLDAALKCYPGSREAARWSAQDCMPIDDIPYIGKFSSQTPDWYVATGFKKWGMTSAMVSAMLISELITQGSSPWEEVFTPQRFHPEASASKLFEDGIKSIKGLSKGFLLGAKQEIEELPIGHGGVVEYQGEKAGVYKKDDGSCHIVNVRCPHLGCQLEWNPDECSWDCPCHGSRFTFDGKLIDGPAQEDLPDA